MNTRVFYDFEATSVSKDADMISVGLVAITEILTMVDVDILKSYGDTFEQQKKNYLKVHPDKKEIKTFYAEFTDFDLNKCNSWVKENVIDKLYLKDECNAWIDYKNKNESVSLFDFFKTNYTFTIKAETNTIQKYLKDWLSQFESIEFWADYDVIDKPMIIDLIADWDKTKPNGFIFTSKEAAEEFKSRYGNIKTSESFKIGLPKHLPNINYYDFYDLHTAFKVKGVNPDINREDFVKKELNKEGYYSITQEEIKELELILGKPKSKKHTALYDAYISYLCYNKLMEI